jgi:aquaporin Z
MKKYVAEFIGTLTLVLFGTGIAIMSGGNLVATSLAFGLAIIASAYVIGGISGCHVNPAVSLAMYMDGRLSKEDFIKYVISQVLGALAGTALLYIILSETKIGTDALGANGFESLSAVDISMMGAIIVEVVLTFVFVYAILGVTADDKKASVAPIVIGLTLTFVHLLGINLTGTSVNPARSLAPAIFQGGKAFEQVWVFILAPLAGGALASIVYKNLNK